MREKLLEQDKNAVITGLDPGVVSTIVLCCSSIQNLFESNNRFQLLAQDYVDDGNGDETKNVRTAYHSSASARSYRKITFLFLSPIKEVINQIGTSYYKVV
ncbi:hypothetical protein K501DRAFT_279105 [Backusella circina FSU 941]|nr:hypothetical protein K501DRAFT_279105 [Backusella circina FSU 941]